MHPELDLAWCEQLLRDIKGRFPRLNVHGFSPPEIVHIAADVGAAGPHGPGAAEGGRLGELAGRRGGNPRGSRPPGRQPRKASADQWLDVCRQWHDLGGRGSATMMFGHVETLAERIEHLERLRRLQDETGGFTAFICWTFQPAHTALAEVPKCGAWEYLKTLAVSRLYLDNFANVQASWVTQGLEIGQMALRFGANDLGSVMIEENVVAAAGTSFQASEGGHSRGDCGGRLSPRRRNVFYELQEETVEPRRERESLARGVSPWERKGRAAKPPEGRHTPHPVLTILPSPPSPAPTPA